jgi:hypothetical protein
VGSWPRSVEKITDRCSALYVIDVMESRDRDRLRAFHRLYRLLGGWLGIDYSMLLVSTAVLGMRSTPTATLLGRHSGYNRYAILIVRNSRWWRSLG